MALSDDPNQKNKPQFGFNVPKGGQGTSHGQGFGGFGGSGGAKSDQSGFGASGFSTQFDWTSGAAGWAGTIPDPAAAPEFFDGVLVKRIIAYLIDVVIIALLVTLLWVFAVVIGIITFGLGFALMAWLIPLSPLAYNTVLIGAAGGATIGMRLMGIHVRSQTGQTPNLLQAFVQSLLFYFSLGFIPLLLAPLFNIHRRTLHDYIAQVVVVNRTQ